MSKQTNDVSSAVDQKKGFKTDGSSTPTESKRHCPNSRNRKSVIDTDGSFWDVHMEEKKSRVLVIGATGRLGQYLTRFSIQSGHPTFALIINSTFSDPSKFVKLESLSSARVTLLKGSLEDEASLEVAVNKVDDVISAVLTKRALDQKLLINVIKRTASIKVPLSLTLHHSHFTDPDKTQVSDLDHGFYSKKSEIRRLIESSKTPHTYICCGLFMRILLQSLVQPCFQSPPMDKVTIFGDGNVKAVFMNEVDAAAFTIKTIDDPRTPNKTLYLRPHGKLSEDDETSSTIHISDFS
ncbi:unnamed protein product [Eruca vesicaria subsp. sativa]|uniref:NmrA-like domain-containing protein n=1 Tax=Eruca vesicaria subsp. sativa TaxID=29727 RepID=A0ABC8KPR4_ERUVS|nr:unnamed protein product [Eruca vesicaria subsp. sativa]